MNINEKIIKNYPLTNKVDCDLNCYCLDKRRYLVFWDEDIRKNSIEEVLNKIGRKTAHPSFTEWKTIIVVGKTTDEFKKKDLFFFNNVNTFVVFYLIDEEKNKIYMNDSWIYVMGYNFKKHVRKINKIIQSQSE